MPHSIWYDHGGRDLIFTLSDTSADMLVACLVLLSMIATAWIWDIIRLPLVLLYYRQNEIQEQVGGLLKKSSGPISFAGRLVKLTWHEERFKRWHIYVLALLAAVYSIGTTAYSIVGPWGLTQKSEKNPVVLAKSHDGSRLWVRPATGAPDAYMPGAGTENLLNATFAGESHFRNCYEKTNHIQCQYLIKDRLHWTGDESIPCPFQETSACSSKDQSAYRVDSGPISLRDIGFNIAQNVTLARRATCVPLDFYEWALHLNGVIFTRGGLYFVNFGNEHASGQGNFVVGDLKGQGVNDYVLRVRQYLYTGREVLHRNLSLLEPGDRNMVVINPMGVTYATTSEDPVFRVNQQQPIKIDDILRQSQNLPITTKYMAEAFGIISCVDQYQICFNSERNCTAFRPISTYLADLQLDLTKDHDEDSPYPLDINAALHALYQPIQLTSIGQVLQSLGASAMAIRRTGLVNHEYQRRIEKDQWKKEIDRWFGLGLAGLQVAVVESVLASDGDGNKEGLVNILTYTPKIKEKLEAMILYKDGQYTNIEGVPLIIICVIIAVGGILRALHGPFIRLIVNKAHWLDRRHVDVLDDEILDPGWEHATKDIAESLWTMLDLSRRWQDASEWCRDRWADLLDFLRATKDQFVSWYESLTRSLAELRQNLTRLRRRTSGLEGAVQLQ